MVGLLVFLHALKHTYLYEEYLLGDEGLMWPIKNNKDSTDNMDPGKPAAEVSQT